MENNKKIKFNEEANIPKDVQEVLQENFNKTLEDPKEALMQQMLGLPTLLSSILKKYPDIELSEKEIEEANGRVSIIGQKQENGNIKFKIYEDAYETPEEAIEELRKFNGPNEYDPTKEEIKDINIIEREHRK